MRLAAIGECMVEATLDPAGPFAGPTRLGFGGDGLVSTSRRLQVRYQNAVGTLHAGARQRRLERRDDRHAGTGFALAAAIDHRARAHLAVHGSEQRNFREVSVAGQENTVPPLARAGIEKLGAIVPTLPVERE